MSEAILLYAVVAIPPEVEKTRGDVQPLSPVFHMPAFSLIAHHPVALH